jgi:3-oxoacyl-[acyl-carrier protein] reductase
MDVNLKGTFLFTRAASKYMMKQRAGAIVNVASIIGLIGNGGQCNYAASKAGVIALTKSVAKELASRNVRANAVAPGFIQTKMTEKLSPEVQKRMMDAIPLARFGTPEDVASVVAFLAGDDAAYVSGQVLNICGGMVT